MSKYILYFEFIFENSSFHSSFISKTVIQITLRENYCLLSFSCSESRWLQLYTALDVCSPMGPVRPGCVVGRDFEQPRFVIMGGNLFSIEALVFFNAFFAFSEKTLDVPCHFQSFLSSWPCGFWFVVWCSWPCKDLGVRGSWGLVNPDHILCLELLLPNIDRIRPVLFFVFLKVIACAICVHFTVYLSWWALL